MKRDYPAELAFQCKAINLPVPARELEFAKAVFGRKWRFDLAWPDLMLAVRTAAEWHNVRLIRHAR